MQACGQTSAVGYESARAGVEPPAAAAVVLVDPGAAEAPAAPEPPLPPAAAAVAAQHCRNSRRCQLSGMQCSTLACRHTWAY